jgi:hypothetical protein
MDGVMIRPVAHGGRSDNRRSRATRADPDSNAAPAASTAGVSEAPPLCPDAHVRSAHHQDAYDYLLDSSGQDILYCLLEMSASEEPYSEPEETKAKLSAYRRVVTEQDHKTVEKTA